MCYAIKVTIFSTVNWRTDLVYAFGTRNVPFSIVHLSETTGTIKQRQSDWNNKHRTQSTRNNNPCRCPPSRKTFLNRRAYYMTRWMYQIFAATVHKNSVQVHKVFSPVTRVHTCTPICSMFNIHTNFYGISHLTRFQTIIIYLLN